MIKGIGLVIIGISSALIGFKCSADIKRRIDTLSMIHYILGEFESQACYSYEPLPEIIRSTIPKTTGIYREWLTNLSKLLCPENALNFSDGFAKSIEIFAENNLKPGEMNILREFGIRIINLNEDRLAQIIGSYLMVLDKYIDELKAEYRVKAKMYQSLGVLMGLFIIIIVI